MRNSGDCVVEVIIVAVASTKTRFLDTTCYVVAASAMVACSTWMADVTAAL